MIVIKTLIEASLQDRCDPETPTNVNGSSVFSPGKIYITYWLFVELVLINVAFLRNFISASTDGGEKCYVYFKKNKKCE